MESALQPLIERIRANAASAAPLCLRGGGSKDFLGEALLGDLLHTGPLNGVTSYEPSELVVTVQAGTRLAELEQLLARSGQCLPFEPPNFGGAATVGGMVAAGLSGPARASVGSVRDYVLGMTVINGRGELLTFGGQVMKNVAGYDVSRLMVGAMGTLGLIVEVSLKVLPIAPAEATLRFECNQQEALHKLHAWGGQPLPLNASRWALDQGQGVLHVRFRGAVAAVGAACSRIGGEQVDNATASADWQACRNLQLPWFAARAGRDLWRLSVPQTAPVLELPDTVLVEWHGAQRWTMAEPAQALTLREAATRVGGSATRFMAQVRAGLEPAFHPLQAPLARIHRELKQQFDPAGIFNRGRLYPGL
jgi:glycolate oxidase FAD binding subunit